MELTGLKAYQNKWSREIHKEKAKNKGWMQTSVVECWSFPLLLGAAERLSAHGLVAKCAGYSFLCFKDLVWVFDVHYCCFCSDLLWWENLTLWYVHPPKHEAEWWECVTLGFVHAVWPVCGEESSGILQTHSVLVTKKLSVGQEKATWLNLWVFCVVYLCFVIRISNRFQ